MDMTMDPEKLKALAAELAKDIKSEKDLGALTQELVKLTVETALNAELDERRDVLDIHQIEYMSALLQGLAKCSRLNM